MLIMKKCLIFSFFSKVFGFMILVYSSSSYSSKNQHYFIILNVVSPNIIYKKQKNRSSRVIRIQDCLRPSFALRAENKIKKNRSSKLGDFLNFIYSWGEQDSNLRRCNQQIYSLPSLAA